MPGQISSAVDVQNWA